MLIEDKFKFYCKITRPFLLFILLISCADPVRGAAFESINVGARPIGLAGAFVAVADDGFAAGYNPAGLVRVTKRRVDSSYSDLYNLGLLNHSYMSYTQPKLGRGTAAVSWTGLSTSSKVQFISYSENTFGMSFGYPIYRGLSLGTTLKYYWVNYTKRATGYGFDLGLLLRFMEGYRVGVMMRNTNHPKIRWATGAVDRLPIEWQIGGSAEIGRRGLATLQWDSTTDRGVKDTLRLGGEYWMQDRRAPVRVGFRGGVIRMPGADWMFTAGTSGIFRNFEIIYALQYHQDLDEQHTFSMNFSF